MKYVYSFLILVICALGSFAELGEKGSTQPSYGTSFDAVVVGTPLDVTQRKLIRVARTFRMSDLYQIPSPAPIMYSTPPPTKSPANAQAKGSQSET